ncbi:MAG: hypothetical protein GY746_01450 [Gammaproteobacteria bacterium]|nr:hypothetical protein [Gammaproteobacteria bacterium]
MVTAKGFIVGLLGPILYISDHAQKVMKIGSYTEVVHQYDKYIDLVLPTADTLASGWIYLEARGADGGWRAYKAGHFINDHYANGGEGATLEGWAKIEDDEQGCIPSGSTIRFIIGQKGDSANSWISTIGSGGGGGTGILFLPPNAVNSKWQHLIIAGVGAGGYGDAFTRGNGGGGYAYADSTSGGASRGSRFGNAAGWKYGTSEADRGGGPTTETG